MATLLELRGLFNDSDLMNKVQAALVIAANNLISATPTTADKKWAAGVFSSPDGEGKKALMAVLAENKDSSVSGIQSAADSGIQAAVDDVVQTLSDAYGA
jgi:hypothetical protein